MWGWSSGGAVGKALAAIPGGAWSSAASPRSGAAGALRRALEGADTLFTVQMPEGTSNDLGAGFAPGVLWTEGGDDGPGEVDPCEGVDCCELLREIDSIENAYTLTSAALRAVQEAINENCRGVFSVAPFYNIYCRRLEAQADALLDQLGELAEMGSERIALADQCHCYAEDCSDR